MEEDVADPDAAAEDVDSDMNQWTSFQTSVKRPSRIHDIADVNKSFLATHDRHMLGELPLLEYRNGKNTNACERTHQ